MAGTFQALPRISYTRSTAEPVAAEEYCGNSGATTSLAGLAASSFVSAEGMEGEP